VLVGGGLAAGLVAGGLGQVLLAPSLGGQALPRELGVAIGWVLLGGLLGRGVAWFIPNLNGWKAAAAGAVGGLLGAGAFLGASELGAYWVGRLAGAVLLGLSIGLMVALVEMTFRSAWLEVVYGPREMGTVNLGPEPISFGGDASSCTIYARGAAPRAFCFWFRDGTVHCEDVPTGARTEMAPGQSLAIGTLNVVVRTASGPSATLGVGPPVPSAPKPAPVPQRHGTIKPPSPADEWGAPPPPPPVQAPAPRSVAHMVEQAPVPARPASGEDGCPTCGRKAPGVAGARYCMVCERKF
jgi:hypothetical protein